MHIRHQRSHLLLQILKLLVIGGFGHGVVVVIVVALAVFILIFGVGVFVVGSGVV